MGTLVVITLLAAGPTFAAGMALRHKTMPPVLTWLGLVSYPVYLVHPLLIELYPDIPGSRHPHPFPGQVLLTAAFVAVLLGCCALGYRFVETPVQRLGKKLAACLDRWYGPDTVPEPSWHAPAGAQARQQPGPVRPACR